MPPAEKEKVKIKIAKGVRHFTDGPRLFAPGTWDVLPKVAERLVEQGKATLVGAGAASKTAPKAPGSKPTVPANNPPATNPRIPPANKEPEESVPTPLPEDFPSREALAAAGFDSVEALKAPDIKEKLAATEGLTPADVTKMGLAISKI